jgi:hypothetical protein
MRWEMAVKKETVMRNDRLRKQERLGYTIVHLVVLIKSYEEESTDVIGQGWLLSGVSSES